MAKTPESEQPDEPEHEREERAEHDALHEHGPAVPEPAHGPPEPPAEAEQERRTGRDGERRDGGVGVEAHLVKDGEVELRDASDA